MTMDPNDKSQRPPGPSRFDPTRTLTAPLTAVERIAPELPFVRPNPLLYPNAGKRTPTPPSLVGLPFVPPSIPDAAANDRDCVAAPLRAGDGVPVFLDGPFEAAAPVVSLKPGRHDLVLIAKLSADLVEGGAAAVREEAAQLDGDRYQGDEPDAPLLVAGDFAPLKPRCDVLVHTEGDEGQGPVAFSLEGRGGSVTRRVDDPRHLGPVSPQDPARLALLGTYDLAWYRTRWPHYAVDLDPRYFQAARVEQQLPDAFGDEAYRITRAGSVPSSLGGRLSGLRPVAVVHLSGGRRRVVPLRLDTIGFFLTDARVDLVWRGMVEVSDDDAPEVEDVFVTGARLDEALPTEDEVELRYQQHLRARAGLDDPESAEAASATDAAEGPTEASVSDADGGDADADAAEASEQADDEAPAEIPEELAEKTPAEVAAMMRDAGADEDDVADMERAMATDPESPPIPPPPEEGDVRALVVARLQAKKSLSGLELCSADLSGLDLSGQDLTGLDLTGASLVDANLAEATLDEAELSGALLGSANLRGVSAKDAVLVGADLRRARLDGADLAGADLTEALLEDAVLDGADLSDARLYDVRAARASLRRCVLRGARAEAAQAPKADLTDALADESVWERADLQQARLESASLVGASLLRARCDGASFIRADLTEARLTRAKLTGAVLVRANLFEANLDRADLRQADLRGANLHAVSTMGTELAGALLGGAILSYSRLEGSSR